MKKIVLSIFILSLIFVISGCFNKDVDKPIVHDDKEFNIRLIKTVNNSKNDNYLISPYSIEIALNMLKSGASNNTLKEIEDLIKERDINDVSNDKVKISNAIFIKDNYKKYVEKTFVNNLKKNYDSEVLYDSFVTPDVINNWAKKKTDNMIDKVLDDMDPNFVLGLINAIAIDVEWNSQFECINTTSEKFTKKDNKKIDVEMMHQMYTTSAYKYFDNENEKGVILPYDNSLEFVGIIPNKDINNYINNITKDTFDNIDKSLNSASSKKRLSLALPRFSYSYDLKDFKNILIQLGVKDAFNGANADFTKIITKANMLKTDIENLYVEDAIHKTYIDLNEKGTKAAAITYFGMYKNSAIIEDEYDIVSIEFNKPFIYMIRDKNTKEILFFGIVYEPNLWKGSTCE